MKNFKYTYLDEETSKRKTATIEAENIDEAQKLLNSKIIIKITETKLAIVSSRGRTGNPAKFYKYYGPLMHRFGFMLAASLGVIEIIDLIIKEFGKVKPLVKAFKEIKERVMSGETLSAAFSYFPNIFDIMVVSTISIGEETGQLDKMFDKLSAFYLRKQRLNKVIKKSMTQPSLTLGVVAVAFVFIVKSVLPKLLGVFMDVGAELPAATKTMLAISDWLNNYFIIAVAIVFGIVTLVKQLLKNPQIRYKADKMIMHLPVLGNYLKNINLAVITSNLGILLQSGVDLQYSMQLIIEITKNTYLKKMLIDSKERIESGMTMSTAFEPEVFLFDEVFNAVLRVGENTGSLDIVLSQLSDEYFEIVEELADKVTTALNFIVLLLITGVVGVMVVAIYGPIQGLSKGLMDANS